MDYLAVTPREFWWGNNFAPNLGHDPVPASMVNYAYLGKEQLGGEICDVVESKGRAERLWIGRKSGLIRGSLGYAFQGRIPDITDLPTLHATVERFAGHPINSREDYQTWYAENFAALSPQRQADLHKTWNEAYFDYDGQDFVRRPDNFVTYSDYREIAPGVALPFREDRVVWLHNGKRFKYIRCQTIVYRIALDADLKTRFAELAPQAGDRVQDQRFDVPVEYDFRSTMTDDEIQALVQQKRAALPRR